MSDSEYFLQQLIVATRWEFDIPTFLFIAFSLLLMLFSIIRKGQLEKLDMIFLQVTFLLIAGFMFIRFYAAVIRASKLTHILETQSPVFEYWYDALQWPTFFFRIALFVLLTVATVYLLLKTGKKS